MSKSALKILTTAEHLFNQHSFTGVGVDLIRDVSGCSKTTLYSHYKNKQQLIVAVLKKRDEKFQGDLQAALDGLSGMDAILALLDWHVAWFLQDDFKGCLFVRAVAETDDSHEAIVQIAQQHKYMVYQLVEQSCQQIQQGQWTDLIYTLIEGLISRCLIEGVKPVWIEQLKMQIQQLLLGKESQV